MSLVGDILALYNNICQKTTFVKNVIYKFGGDSIILNQIIIKSIIKISNP